VQVAFHSQLAEISGDRIYQEQLQFILMELTRDFLLNSVFENWVLFRTGAFKTSIDWEVKTIQQTLPWCRGRNHLGRTVRHAKTGAEVFRKEPHCRFVGFRILLHEIFHGFEQQTLPFDVSRVLRPLLAFATAGIGKNGDGENFCHCKYLTLTNFFDAL
jgi:hypothetical protein